MNVSTTYRSAPSMTCNAPARSFPDAAAAIDHARAAASAFKIAYMVYEAGAGRLRLVARFAPAPPAPRPPPRIICIPGICDLCLRWQDSFVGPRGTQRSRRRGWAS
jgi:hypothetical protein